MVNNMRALVKAAQNLHINITDETTAAAFYPTKLDSDESRNPNTIFAQMKTLWNDVGIQETYLRRHEFQIDESTKYYFDSIDRISQPDYIPTIQDVLKTYVKTSAIYEKEMHVINNLTLRVFDMGGARSERRKWIFAITGEEQEKVVNHQEHAYIIFIASLSEYNQCLREDHKKNRMLESIELFEYVCKTYSNKYNIILIFNKIDVFKTKLESGLNLTTCFPEYKGGCNFMNAEQFIMDKYKAVANSYDKLIPLFKISATEVESCKNTLNTFFRVLQYM